MAIAIFQKDHSAFVKVFATQELANEYGYTNEDIYKSVTISDSEFNDIRLYVRTPESIDSDNNISWMTLTITPALTEQDFKDHIKRLLSQLRTVNTHHPNHSQTNMFNDYIDYLEGIDTSSITWPLAKNVENYVSDQGQTFFHPHEIP